MALTIQEAVDKYMAEVQTGPSSETPRTYGAALRALEIYLKQASVDSKKTALTGLTAEHFVDLPHFLKGEHFRSRQNPHTIATYLSVYLSWLRFIIRERLHPALAGESERIRAVYRRQRPKAQRLPRALSEEDIEAIIRAARGKKEEKKARLELARLRDIALIETFRCTGARVGEIVGALVEDLDAKDRTLRITGKGNKQRMLLFDGTGWQALTAYLRKRNTMDWQHTEKLTPLFCRHSKPAGKRLQRLSQRSMRNILHGLAGKAKVRRRATPHTLRHAFGKRVLESTGDLAATQDLLGHASPATTRIYAQLVSSRLRQAHRKAFPV